MILELLKNQQNSNNNQPVKLSPTPKGQQDDEEFHKMDKKLYSSALSSYCEESHQKDVQDKSIRNSPKAKSSNKTLELSKEKSRRKSYYPRGMELSRIVSMDKVTSKTAKTYQNVEIVKQNKAFLFSEATSSEEEEFNEDDQNIPLIAKLATAQFHKLSKLREKIKKQGDIDSQDLILKQRAEKRKYQYVLSYRANYKLLWDAFIICLALIVSIMNSICVSLDPPFRRTAGFPAINLIVDFIFLLDMILIFRTSRLNFLLGEETNDPSQLALIYIKSYRFWVDILSIIPFEMFDDKDLLILFSMLKIFRIGRFNKILQNTNLVSQSKIFLKLIYMYVLLILYLHFLACLIYYIFNLNKSWTPPCETLGVGSKFYQIDDDLFKYATLIHYSVLMYLINETSPTVLYERQFVQVVAIISTIVNVVIFGNITVLVSELKKKENQIQENQDAASTAMTNLKLPINLRINIQTQMQVLQSTRDEPEELQIFLNSISASKRLKVQVCVMNRELRNNKLISGMAKKKFDAFIEFMVSRMDLILSNPEDIIIKEGESLDENDCMYFIAKGVCYAEQKDRIFQQNTQNYLRNLGPGDYFGEISLIYNCKRQASVISQNYSTLARLCYEKFKEVVQKYPKLQTQMKGQIKGYDDPVTKFMTETLEKIPYYDYFDDDDRISIIYNFTMRNYQKGSLIQAQGEIPENLTIISRGVAQVFTTVKSEQFPIEYLCHGAIINQNMFLLQKPVQMPIQCVTSVMVLNFSYEKLKIIRDKNSESNLNKELDILTKYYQKEGIEKIYLDYITPTPFNLQVDDIKFARRQELTRQLKNAGIQILMNYRKKNNKVNFNDMLQNIIKKIKEQKRMEKQKKSLLAQRMSAGESTELPAISGVQASEIHAFLNQMEKAVEFQSEMIESIDTRFQFSITEGAANARLIKQKEMENKAKQRKKKNMIIMNDEQLVLKLHKSGPSNDNTGSKMMRQKLGDRGKVESERVTSNSPDHRQNDQRNVTPKKSALNVGGGKESKYQQPKGVRDSVEDDEIDWVLKDNQAQPRKSKFDIQDGRDTSPDGGSSGLKFLQDDDIPTTHAKKNPQIDRSQKMKQQDQSQRVTQKRLETNISEDQDGPSTKFNQKQADEERKNQDMNNDSDLIAKNLNFDQSKGSEAGKEIKEKEKDKDKQNTNNSGKNPMGDTQSSLGKLMRELDSESSNKRAKLMDQKNRHSKLNQEPDYDRL